MNVLPIVVLCILTLGFVPLAMNTPLAITTSTPAVTSTTTTKTTTTTPDICTNALCQSPNPQNKTFDPSTIPGYFGTDIGKFDVQTAKDGFKWATAPQDSLTMGIPTVGSPVPNDKVYYNSTHTAYKLAGPFGTLDVFFKQTQYSIKISIHSSFSSSQTVCLPFSSPSPIIQQSGPDSPTNKTIVFFPSIKAGNQIFDWRDIIVSTPTWSSVTNSLCISLPSGISNIDPIALDGHGTNGCSPASSCTVTLTTTTTNDIVVIFVSIYLNNAVTGVTVAGNAATLRTTYLVGISRLEEWYYISASTLSSASVVVSWASSVFSNIDAFGISGGNTATPYDSNVAVPAKASGNSGKPTVTGISTSNANDMILAFGGCNSNTVEIVGNIAGSSATLIDATTVSTVDAYSEYLAVSSTQSGVSADFGSSAPSCWLIMADAVQQSAATNQPVILVLAVNPSPSPDGGGIGKCGVSCVFGGNVMISSTTSITIGTTSSTITIIAQEFSGYIWNGWSGATTYVHDTINPTQTLSITSFATTTQSSTLTANFVNPVAAGGAPTPNYLWLLMIPLFMVVVFAIARRR